MATMPKSASQTNVGPALKIDGLVVSCVGIEKFYGAVKALSGVTLEVPSGDCIAVLGPNGAGKTTLFKMLLGLIQPTAGTISIGGFKPGQRVVQSAIGYLPESVAFDRAATGAETLRYFARLKGVDVGTCDALFDEVGLGRAAHRRIGTYSKGMRQRLGLAQALLGDPRLMLLDEPTSGLDPELRAQFYRIIEKLRGNGVTTIIATHALSEIETVVDRFAIITHGHLQAYGRLDELKAQAGLPVRMRVSVGDGDAPSAAASVKGALRVTRVNGRHIEIECDEDRKIDAVRTLAELKPQIGDLEISQPTLDRLYEYFTQQDERP